MGTSQPSAGIPSDVSVNQQWYDRGASQMTLESSKILNAKIVQNVSLLQLTPQERELMGKLWTSDTLLRFATDLDTAAKRKAGLQGSPEYQPLLASIAILLKAFATRAETESKIIAHLERITLVLPTVDYLRTVAGNSHMNKAVSGICLEVGNYLFEALHYFKNKGRIAMISTFDTKFGGHIQAIEAYVESMRHLRDTATLAVSLDTLGKLDQTSQLLLQMFQQSQTTMLAMSLQLEQCRINTSEQLTFSARMRAQDISDALFPERFNSDILIAEIERSAQLLTPRERWENRGLHLPLEKWFECKARPLLCFSGSHRKNRVSFLSSFSLDLASTLTLEPNIGIAYVFCDLCSNDQLTTDLFSRYLTAQLLHAHPKTSLDHMDRLSMRRVQAVKAREKSQAQAAFEFFADTLDAVRTQLDWPSGGYLIIIDRIDLLADSKGFGTVTNLLPALQNLSTRLEDVSFIITADSTADSFRNLRSETIAHVELGMPAPVMMQTSV